MNRKEQLKFCSVCLNRKFDPQQGIICNLTDKPADFESYCKSYQVDEVKKKEQQEEVQKTLPTEALIEALPEEIKNHLRIHQSMGFALFGGILVAIMGAIGWAAISIITKYQIGWMAIGVGLLVGFSIRFFGAGIDKKFGVLGGVLAVFSCLLGNLLSQVGFYAYEQGLPYLEVLGYLTPILSWEIIMDSFEPIDLFFYCIAGFEGYKFAFRTIPLSLEKGRDYIPQGAGLRLPLAVVSALLIGFIWFLLSSNSVIEKVNYYESGNLLSKGKMDHGLAEGEWEYYYESGTIGAKGNYSKGLEDGSWQYYDEDGKLRSEKVYFKGLEHGNYTEFNEEGLKFQQGEYSYGRMSGIWTTFYPSGSIMSQGNYYLDIPDGEWVYYHENGQISQKGKFENGENTGLWEVWDENGVIMEESFHIPGEGVEWITYREPKGNLAVKEGNGKYLGYHPNGGIAVFGNIQDKKMTGDWTFFDEEGIARSVMRYENGKGKMWLIRNSYGNEMVKNGTGKFVNYFDSGLVEQEGEYMDGLKEGEWFLYFEGDGKPLMEESRYKKDLLEGRYVTHHASGKEALIGQYKTGKRIGKWTWYTEEGLVDSEVNYVDGKKEGEQVFYNEFEAILKKEIYKEGKLLETIVP
jgi:antitoxin component YwqK of YwqJK toxin-antitoxin module